VVIQAREVAPVTPAEVAAEAVAPLRLTHLLHIDTTFKFREMIEFRVRTVRELGLDLLVHSADRDVEEAAGVVIGALLDRNLLG
jgi:3'-phosphoadenosine 5'-phosphosulfate sulfotransferase (PAPS reductase)/FAD synthetase